MNSFLFFQPWSFTSHVISLLLFSTPRIYVSSFPYHVQLLDWTIFILSNNECPFLIVTAQCISPSLSLIHSLPILIPLYSHPLIFPLSSLVNGDWSNAYLISPSPLWILSLLSILSRFSNWRGIRDTEETLPFLYLFVASLSLPLA